MGEIAIPRNIFQTWKNNDPPDHWKDSPSSIRKYMPYWNYFFFTDEDNLNFVKKHFPEYLLTYNSFPYPIQRVDMVRVMYLYIYGGVYMDLDYAVNKPLDSLFYDKKNLYFLPSSNSPEYFTNSFMASIPKHPFWLKYLENMTKPAPSWAIVNHLEVMFTTGPVILTKTIQENAPDFTKLNSEQVSPCDVSQIETCNSNSYLIILEGQSWNGWDGKLFNFLNCNFKFILWGFFLVISIVAIYYRNKYKKCKRKN